MRHLFTCLRKIPDALLGLGELLVQFGDFNLVHQGRCGHEVLGLDVNVHRLVVLLPELVQPRGVVVLPQAGQNCATVTAQLLVSAVLRHCDAAAQVSLAQACVSPGVTTQLHSLAIEERYIIMQGQGLMELSEAEVFTVNVGDVVVIPAGVPQRIRNVLDEELKFLCVCTPRFQPEHYTVLETAQTQPLDIVL